MPFSSSIFFSLSYWKMSPVVTFRGGKYIAFPPISFSMSVYLQIEYTVILYSCHFHLHLVIIISYSTGLQQNVVTLWKEKIHSFPSYLLFHVCDLFSYDNVNVNMYLEAVLLLVGSLSHWCSELVSARQTKC